MKPSPKVVISLKSLSNISFSQAIFIKKQKETIAKKDKELAKLRKEKQEYKEFLKHQSDRIKGLLGVMLQVPSSADIELKD